MRGRAGASSDLECCCSEFRTCGPHVGWVERFATKSRWVLCIAGASREPGVRCSFIISRYSSELRAGCLSCSAGPAQGVIRDVERFGAHRHNGDTCTFRHAIRRPIATLSARAAQGAGSAALCRFEDPSRGSRSTGWRGERGQRAHSTIIEPFVVEPLVGRVTHLQRQPSVWFLESCPSDEARDQTRAWHGERKARPELSRSHCLLPSDC